MLDEHGTSELVSFVEKPNVKHAKKMLRLATFLECGDIFVQRSKMLDAFKAYAPETMNLVLKAFNQSSNLGS